MNIIVAAIALAVAFPAAAQAACHDSPAGQGQQAMAEHKDGCCADKHGNDKMDRCGEDAKRSSGEREAPHVHPKS